MPGLQGPPKPGVFCRYGSRRAGSTGPPPPRSVRTCTGCRTTHRLSDAYAGGGGRGARMHVHPPQTVAEPRPSDRRRPVRIRSCGTPDGGGSVRIGDAGLSVEAQDACIQTATQTAPPRPDTAHSYPQRAGTTAVWAQGPFCGPAGHRASSTSPSPRIPVPARVQWVVRHLPGRPPRTAGHAPAARGDRDLRGGGGRNRPAPYRPAHSGTGLFPVQNRGFFVRLYAHTRLPLPGSHRRFGDPPARHRFCGGGGS